MRYIFITILITLFISCTNDSEPEPIVDFTAENEKEILDYIADNDLNAQKSESGLYYVLIEEGSGEQPTLNSNVTVIYKGYFTNGTVFDERADGISFDIPQLISGFAEGLSYLKEGGNGILLLPSRLAYGNFGSGPIPPGAVLIFDIALVSVNQ